MPSGVYERKPKLRYEGRRMTATAPILIDTMPLHMPNWRKLLAHLKASSLPQYDRFEITDMLTGTTIGAWEWRNKGDEMIGQIGDKATNSGWYNVEA